MLEHDWLMCRDPRKLLDRLQGFYSPAMVGDTETYYPWTVSDRKFRLLACAWWHADVARMRRVSIDVNFTNNLVAAISAAEELADTNRRSHQPDGVFSVLANTGIQAAQQTLDTLLLSPVLDRPVLTAAVHEVLGNPFRPVATISGQGLVKDTLSPVVEPTTGYYTHWDDAWCTADVLNMATAIYATRAWTELPVLADALEDAGCTSLPIITHLRKRLWCPLCSNTGRILTDVVVPNSPGTSMLFRTKTEKRLMPCLVCNGVSGGQPIEHVLGCWALDVVLGKK